MICGRFNLRFQLLLNPQPISPYIVQLWFKISAIGIKINDEMCGVEVKDWGAERTVTCRIIWSSHLLCTGWIELCWCGCCDLSAWYQFPCCQNYKTSKRHFPLSHQTLLKRRILRYIFRVWLWRDRLYLGTVKLDEPPLPSPEQPRIWNLPNRSSVESTTANKMAAHLLRSQYSFTRSIIKMLG